jgi:hypothetical protein
MPEKKTKSATFSVSGQKHVVKKTGKDVVVTHPDAKPGKYKTIDLTKTSGAKTVAEGKKAVKKYHKTHKD